MYCVYLGKATINQGNGNAWKIDVHLLPERNAKNNEMAVEINVQQIMLSFLNARVFS